MNDQRGDELLEKMLTYHEFCDLMTDAWLTAEAATNEYPSRMFQHELFVKLEDTDHGREAHVHHGQGHQRNRA